MNEPISWDPSLVKKFSSSNHYKLLTQLKNEVKKYPLNNKKKVSRLPIKESDLEYKTNSSKLHTEQTLYTSNTITSNEVLSNKSTVSFNNSKNFSIYNNNSDICSRKQNDSYLQDQAKPNEEVESTTFKDRLNQIDMK